MVTQVFEVLGAALAFFWLAVSFVVIGTIVVLLIRELFDDQGGGD